MPFLKMAEDFLAIVNILHVLLMPMIIETGEREDGQPSPCRYGYGSC